MAMSQLQVVICNLYPLFYKYLWAMAKTGVSDAYLSQNGCTESVLAISVRSAPIFTRFCPKTTGYPRSFLLCTASSRFRTFYLPFRWATRTDPARTTRITRKTAHVTVEIKHTSPDHKNDLQSDVYRSMDSSWCCRFSQRTAASSNDRQCPFTGTQYFWGGASSWSLQ